MIDPPGFVLESFDPVGRLREHYPVYRRQDDEVITWEGHPVETGVVMPDGTKFDDIRDLKRHLIQNPDIFARCLAENLLVYATGRPMNFADQKVIDEIVVGTKQRGNGFADLIVEIVLSESFAAKQA